MPRIGPAPRRSTWTSIPGGLRIVIPAPRRWVVALFLSAWLCAWAAGLVAAASQLLGPAQGAPSPAPVAFLLVWLAGWLAGGAFVAWTVAWNVAGREVVSISGAKLSVRREALGVGRTRTFDAAAVRDVRAAFSAGALGSIRREATGRGAIAFEAGGKTHHLGAGLDDAEAEQIAAALRDRLPAAS